MGLICKVLHSTGFSCYFRLRIICKHNTLSGYDYLLFAWIDCEWIAFLLLFSELLFSVLV